MLGGCGTGKGTGWLPAGGIHASQGTFSSTGQPHYNAIFGVHVNRPCYN